MSSLEIGARVDPNRPVFETNPNTSSIARTPESSTILQVKAIDASGAQDHKRGWLNWVDFFWDENDLPLEHEITASIRFGQGTVAMYSSLYEAGEVSAKSLRVYTPPELRLFHSYTVRQAGGNGDQLISIGAHNYFVFATSEVGSNLRFPSHANVNAAGDYTAYWTTPN